MSARQAMRHAMRSIVGVAALGALAAGCAEPAFSAHVRDNSVEDIARALAAVHPSPVEARPTAYLVTTDKRLVAYDLAAGKVAWDVAAEVGSRLAVGDGFLAHRRGKAQLAVRSATSGAERCSIALRPGEEFVGLAAARDQRRLYYVVQSTRAEGRVSSLVAASADTCAELWRDEAEGSIGAPAARGGVVLVPFAYQNVVVLDGVSGAELARVRATDASLTFVRATPEGFFYGDDKGVYLLNAKSAAGTRKGSAYVEARLASSQIHTFYFWDAYRVSQADYTAFDRNRLLWRAEPHGDSVAFRDGQAYLHSYRYFFAFDAATGDVRWGYAHPKVDLVGSGDVGPAILFASVDGELGALDARSGALVWSKRTDLKVAGVTFDADGFAPGTGAPAPLLQTLADIAWDHDARFTAVKVFAVGAIGRVPGVEATAKLVELVTKEGVPPAVAKAAGEALLARRDASAKSVYRDALAVRYDYLADRRSHGVDVLARVVAAIDDKEAAPLLAAHLVDPATPLPALKEIVRALVALGGAPSVAALRDLVLTYRADAAFLADPQPLELAGDGLLALAGDGGRRTVAFVAEEPRTLAPLAVYLRRALHGGAPEPPPAKPADRVAPARASVR